jgi:hypothetical protein
MDPIRRHALRAAATSTDEKGRSMRPTSSVTLPALAVLAAFAFSVPGSAQAAPKGVKPGEIVAGVCDTIPKDGTCAEIVVTDKAKKGDALQALKKLCPKAKATGTCPAAKQIGTCRILKDIVNHYYSKGGKVWELDGAKTECEKNMGKWVE